MMFWLVVSFISSSFLLVGNRAVTFIIIFCLWWLEPEVKLDVVEARDIASSSDSLQEERATHRALLAHARLGLPGKFRS